MSGRLFTWLSGGALALSILMTAGLLALLVWMGMGFFWPKPVYEYRLKSGGRIQGEQVERRAKRTAPLTTEINIRRGNRDVYGLDFVWIDEASVAATSTPPDIALLERREYGNFYGRLVAIEHAGKKVGLEGDALWRDFRRRIDEKAVEHDRILDIEKGENDDINRELEALRLAERRVEMSALDASATERRLKEIAALRAPWTKRSEAVSKRLIELRNALEDTVCTFETAEGERRDFLVSNVIRAIKPNAMGFVSKVGLYATRVWEFIWDEPRESNTEGGIFPAIFGTVLMVFLMTFAVTPLGVLAALYLREYAKDGPVVRFVRIAVNNLAGVPSIVFGVFGLGFFVYVIGGTIDSVFFPERLPTPTYGTGGILWAALTLALLTVPVVIVATEEGLASVPSIVRQGSTALGATKFETTWRVVLPAAGPGILTGVILAIARAAGEVAPLMIVGMVKLADVPVDRHFPYLHLDQKFMHLGFHIYDVGFQSPNVEATKPLVYATALLLVLIVTGMNLVAIAIRNHLRRKYATSAV